MGTALGSGVAGRLGNASLDNGFGQGVPASSLSKPIPAAVTGVRLTKGQTGASDKWNICPVQFDRSVGNLHVSGTMEAIFAAAHKRP